jgi:hypothetical protein
MCRAVRRSSVGRVGFWPRAGLPAGLCYLIGRREEDREGELEGGEVTTRIGLENDYVEYEYPHRRTPRCRPFNKAGYLTIDLASRVSGPKSLLRTLSLSEPCISTSGVALMTVRCAKRMGIMGGKASTILSPPPGYTTLGGIYTITGIVRGRPRAPEPA